MCDVADETTKGWTEKWRIARKEHRCVGCHETIRAGDRYHYGSGVFDGSGFSVKHCARCWAMVEALEKKPDRVWGESVNIYLDCGEVWSDPPDEIAALAFALPSDFAQDAQR